MPSTAMAWRTAVASPGSPGVRSAICGLPSRAPAIVPDVMTAIAPSTWMLCGVRTTTTSAAARSKRRPTSSMPRRVAAARSRCSGGQASAIAMPPCGAMHPKTSPTPRRLASALADPAGLELSLGPPHPGRRLVERRRPGHDGPVGEREPRAMTGALDGVADDRPVRERAAGGRAHVVKRREPVPLAHEHQRLSAGLRLRRPALGDLAHVERGPVRAAAAPRVAVDHLAEGEDEVAPDVRAGDDEGVAERREENGLVRLPRPVPLPDDPPEPLRDHPHPHHRAP